MKHSGKLAGKLTTINEALRKTKDSFEKLGQANENHITNKNSNLMKNSLIRSLLPPNLPILEYLGRGRPGQTKPTLVFFAVILVLCVLPSPVLTKTTNVSPGNGTLNTAITAADSGDVLQLEAG